MSNTRYIDIDSTYRDRTAWPLPGQFEVQLSQSGTKGRNDALDPVSLAAPIKVWTSNKFDTTGAGIDVSGTIVTTSGVPPAVGSSGSQQTIIVEFSGTEDPQIIEDYYLNAMLVDTSATPDQQRRILSSKYISTVAGVITLQFVVETAFGDAVVDGDTVIISDPTDLSDVNNPQIFVPDGHPAQDYYISYLLYNETRNESRRITGYDVITHLLTVDTTQSVASTPTEGPVTTWTVTDDYCIRKALPTFTGTLGGSTLTSVTFPVGVSTANDYYNGEFVRITNSVADNEIRKITDYDGTTRIATVFPPFSASPGAVTFEILPFSYDNATPLNYTGSDVSQQQMVCYEIELLNLTLPNRTLVVGNGSRITFYQYVYVEFTNVSAANAGMNGVIYSNNPNATRMLFKCAIDDVPNPILSPFLKIDGDGMVQTVKFNPNDNLKFSVRLPSGEVFQTNQTENQSPLTPNPDMQISALFSIRRL